MQTFLPNQGQCDSNYFKSPAPCLRDHCSNRGDGQSVPNMTIYYYKETQQNNDDPSVLLLGISFFQKLALENEHLRREQMYINYNQHTSLQINISALLWS